MSEQQHQCQHDDCSEPATAQWQRQAAHAEHGRALELRDSGGPDRVDPAGSYTTAVFACPGHALGPEAASLLHAPDCRAPYFGCSCA